MAEFETDYLELTLTSDSKLSRIILATLRQENVLLLSSDEYENYFKDNDVVEKIIFVFALQAKNSDVEGKIKERIIGRIKPIRSVYEIEWSFLNIRDLDDLTKKSITHFCEIEWSKPLEVSKSKLPSQFSDLFGKKDGFNEIKEIEGHKLRDVLEYPSDFYKKIYSQLKDEDYYFETESDNSSSDDSDSSSDSQESESSDSSSDSKESGKQRKRKNDRKSEKKRKQSRDRHRSRRDRDRSAGKKKDKSRKSKHHRRDRSRSKSKDRKRDRKQKHKRRDDKKNKKIRKDDAKPKNRNRKRKRNRDRNRRKQSAAISEKDRHKDKDKNPTLQKQEDPKRKSPILSKEEKQIRDNEGRPEKKVKLNQGQGEERDKSQENALSKKKKIPLSERFKEDLNNN